jgi:predicted RNA-binding protein with EMAP domain
MTLTWKQYCYFSVEEIDQATYNVIKIKDKIIELNEKLKSTDDDKKVNIKDLIERLEMSKNCIIYYYGLSIPI